MNKPIINFNLQSAASPSRFAQELVKTLCLFSLNCGCESCANEVIQCAECVECQISMREIANDQFVKARSGAAQEVSPRQKAMQAAKEIESDCIEQSDEGYAFEVSRAAIIIEKLLGEEVSPPSPWRQGSKIPLNIYDGDRPICQTHTVADAKRIVESVNQGDTRELKAALRKIVIEEIMTSTGPTGGWLDSPKALCASILHKMEACKGVTTND